MTKQTWTATLSAVLFVVLAAVIALVPVPFVVWSPGSTYNLFGKADGANAITITGAATYPTSGELLMTTIGVTSPTSTLSLPEMFFAYWLPYREVLPRVAVYREGEDATEINEGESQLMTDSQSDAVVAAVRQAGIPVYTWPMIESVTSSGPANGILEPGDLITAVGTTNTTGAKAVQEEIAKHHVGEALVFVVMRDGEELHLSVTTRATTANPDKPIVGITLGPGYTYGPSVSFAIDPVVGGSSAGLMFSLAITDMLTEADLVDGRVIAGTGTMAADGTVGAIGGVQEKIAAAAKDGATVFLLPRGNCIDAVERPEGIRLVPVDSLSEAVAAVNTLNSGEADALPGCG